MPSDREANRDMNEGNKGKTGEVRKEAEQTRKRANTNGQNELKAKEEKIGKTDETK